jgi:hypothetical protein
MLKKKPGGGKAVSILLNQAAHAFFTANLNEWNIAQTLLNSPGVRSRFAVSPFGFDQKPGNISLQNQKIDFFLSFCQCL